MPSNELGRKLKYAAGKYLPFLKIAPPVTDRKLVMNLRPLHNNQLTWEKGANGDVVLIVPANKNVGPVTRAIAKWAQAPSQRKVELDEVGSFVWELCDGTNTVESIVQQTGRHYHMNRREAEVSVTLFLEMLHDRHFIAFFKKTRKAG